MTTDGYSVVTPRQQSPRRWSHVRAGASAYERGKRAVIVEAEQHVGPGENFEHVPAGARKQVVQDTASLNAFTTRVVMVWHVGRWCRCQGANCASASILSHYSVSLHLQVSSGPKIGLEVICVMARAAGRKPSSPGRDRAPARAEASALPEVLQFMRLLWAIVHALQTQSKEMSKVFGVTGPQRLVLRVVGLFPGVSPGALAEILHLHPSTVTGVLQRLVSQGLLRRSTDAGDRRRSVLVLTPKGTRVNTSRKGTVERAVQETLEQVAPSDLSATADVLSRLARCLTDSRRC